MTVSGITAEVTNRVLDDRSVALVHAREKAQYAKGKWSVNGIQGRRAITNILSSPMLTVMEPYRAPEC